MINPDFEARYKLIQPETRRVRSAYRSPIRSANLNLFQNSLVNDINSLYNEIDSIKTKIDDRFDKIYEEGADLTNSESINSIRYYLEELTRIRTRINNLK